MSSFTHRLRVLLVDDEPGIGEVLRIELKRMGHDVTVCENGQKAVHAIDENSFDAAIIDLRMVGMTGWDVVDHLRRISPETEFVISSAHGNMDDAIQAVRQGAYDFLPKPVKLFEIANVLQRIGDKLALTNKAIALESRLKAVQGASKLIGNSSAMQRVNKLIEKIAPTDSSVMILGETGTGKELVARRVHDLSRRAQAPFVPINCGALPENLVESEFFGHRKGAFTGADAARKGLIEVANGGTLFLDELGELDKSMQVKLLRFLESGEVRRVGENEPFHVDVRIVCATNRDLQEMVADGKFREDLFFRVNTFEIHLPPLRERKEDIPDLARFLIARHLSRPDVPANFLGPDVLDHLSAHHWPGNVRELANALEHAVILSNGQSISRDDLPSLMPLSRLSSAAGNSSAVPMPSLPLRQALYAFERAKIEESLRKHGGNKTAAAAELGISVKTLYNKVLMYENGFVAEPQE